MRLGRQPTSQSLTTNSVAFGILVASAWARWSLRGGALELAASAMTLVGIGFFVYSQTFTKVQNCDFDISAAEARGVKLRFSLMVSIGFGLVFVLLAFLLFILAYAVRQDNTGFAPLAATTVGLIVSYLISMCASAIFWSRASPLL